MTHPVNAMLNYTHLVAAGKAKIQALAGKYDPIIGMRYHDYREGPAYALDLVEPIRPSVDQAIMKFASERKLYPADFSSRSEGIRRLDPQSVRRLVELSLAVGLPSRVECVRRSAQLSLLG